MQSSPLKRKAGRPPAGVGKDGTPEKTSEYPKLSISIRPSTRAALNAVAALESRPIWQIIDDGIKAYIEAMPKEDRKMIEAIALRIKDR